MCEEFCRNTVIGFSNINNKSFNRYEEAMDYILNYRSEEDTASAAVYMLNKHIAQVFKSCPSKVLAAVQETVRKFRLKSEGACS